MIFTLRQLQEKCREQKQPLFIAFTDLTRAFPCEQGRPIQSLREDRVPTEAAEDGDVVPRTEDMKGTVLFDGSSSAAFPISNGVKQGCVLALKLWHLLLSAAVLCLQ